MEIRTETKRIRPAPAAPGGKTIEQRRARWWRAAGTAALAFGALAAFGDASSGEDKGAPVMLGATAAPNAVTTWSEVAAATITGTGTANVTPEEQRPNYVLDLPTVHLAIYDALMAITGTHKPYASDVQAPQGSASQEAAVAAAAYRVLQVLFPNRGALYQAAYNSAVATIADGASKSQGLAIGTAAANAVLNLRANDGRAVVLPPFVQGTAPGQFRTANAPGLANPWLPNVRPFTMQHAAQFRPAGPPALTSAAYAAAFNETKALGSAASTTRTAEQSDVARFNTEPPPRFAPRNMRTFSSNQTSLADAARLMAMLWVAQADATIACFEAKYFYGAWRPNTAITLADTDGNADTAPDAAWAPSVPTPNHPEYPAAHACYAGALAEVVRAYYDTRQVAFTFDSQAAGVIGTSRTFATTTALVDELLMARIWGGMHFRFSSDDGAALGKSVAQWVLAQRFQAR